ncbi:MAG: hypothetical protein ABL890_00525 [Candidatus Peribacteraceae bacterium]
MHRIVLLLPLAATLLTGCTEPAIDPSEVIRRSLYAGSSTESYEFSAHVVATARGPIVYSGSAILQGSVRRSGVIASTVSLSMERIQGTASDRVDGVVGMRYPGNRILYLDLSAISGHVGSELQAQLSGATFDGWTALTMTGVSIQPSFPTEEEIQAQASAFVVLRDRSTRSGDYMFDVGFAPGVVSALVNGARDDAITGALTIDRETFALKRALWTMVALPTPIGNMTGTVDVTFSSFNEVTLPVMPLFTGSSLPFDTLFDTISAAVPISS